VIASLYFTIAKTECLSNHLVFKGGTCLRKCYFEKYRFSQDLEFAREQHCPIEMDLETLFIEAIHQTNLEVKKRNYGMQFYGEMYKRSALKSEKSSEITQEGFMVFVKYPWHREPCIKIKIDVNLCESVFLEKRQHSLIHLYTEDLPGVLFTYSLEEMMEQQILSLLDFNAVIQKQGWTTSKIRNLYDLWFLMGLSNNYLDQRLVPELVWKKKCLAQNREFIFPNALFDSRLQANFETAWHQWIDLLTVKQIDSKTVLPDLKKFFRKMFC
jgi:predicted nucleotidyltransferase component of viral defense system